MFSKRRMGFLSISLAPIHRVDEPGAMVQPIDANSGAAGERGFVSPFAWIFFEAFFLKCVGW